MKTLTIIVPVYFNAPSLPILFEKLRTVEAELMHKSVAVELIFVDDGSKDNSLDELLKIKQARPETKVVKLTRNFGAMHAFKCGLQFVTGDCMIGLAADLQDPPELILQLVDKWLAGSKFTICTRISRDDPPLSKLYSAAFYRMLHLLVMPDYPVGGYDMALLDKDLIPHMQRSSKNQHPALLAFWLGYKPEVIPYRRLKREHGKSRWTFRKKLNTFLDIMLGFSVTPIRLISIIGLFVSLGSFVYGTSVVLYALFNTLPVQGFASLAALITFLLGLIIMMLGVIGEYLWRIFDEVNLRPEVVVERVY